MVVQILESLFGPWLCWLVFRTLTLLVIGLCGALLSCFASWATPQVANSFPDTDPLMQRVVQNQKEVESLVNAYTFTDTQTVYLGQKRTGAKPTHRYLLHHANPVRIFCDSCGA
jgi:hypothetical protein